MKRCLKRHCLMAACLGAALQLGTAAASAQNQACTRTQDGAVVCGAADSTCIADRRGDIVCSTPGGGILLDMHGTAKCGPGYCARDQEGEIWCSGTPRGGAAADSNGKAHCTDRCVRGTATACVLAKPAR